MENFSQDNWSEIVFGTKDSAESQAIHRALKSGRLRKLAPRLYTSNLKDSPANIIKRHLYQILGHLFPGAVLSYRTALEAGPSKEGMIVLSYKYTKKLSLPGIIIRLIQSTGAIEGDTPFMDKLFLASRERALLENLQPSRDKGSSAKTLPKSFIEEYLDKLCRHYGPEELNRVRDKARELSSILNMHREFKILDKMIGALLGTQKSDILETEMGLARAEGVPYDSYRLELFAHLFASLSQAILPIRESHIHSETSLNNFAFFESYFSNYIEGTEFEVEEAADIVFRGKINIKRSEDAHDILGTFRLVSSINEMQKTPRTINELYALLQARHAVLMAARKDKEPGQFKTLVNRAGNTVFVLPSLVKGTLEKGFDFYRKLKSGLARSIFMMFLIAEVHPFLDGNGRIARIMMNAELEAAGESRIIIPTVYREDYILALRRLSREKDPSPTIRMLQRAQAFTDSIDYSDYNLCLAQFRKANAFMEPSDGKLKFIERQ